MNVGIVGCGLVGGKRAAALAGATLALCADASPDRARALAERVAGCRVAESWRALVASPAVGLVIVATPHAALADIALTAVRAGKHVLVEKPAARRAAELEPVIRAARDAGVLVRVGFNHRYHRAVRRAKTMADAGAIGPLMHLRARYGHGGRLGYEKEWRADPAVSGGGELIDQGVHLIDLARHFLGGVTGITGRAVTSFWRMPVDDNAFLILSAPGNRTAFLHASCTEWKNLFSLEVFGTRGKLTVEGLGGSYGEERLVLHAMSPAMGPPAESIEAFPGPDDSWQVEFTEFLEDIAMRRAPSASLEDARAALEVVERVYRESGYDHHA